MRQFLRQCLPAISLSLITCLSIAAPSPAAERIHFQYGLFGFSISRQELETFAETGASEGWLKKLLSQFKPETQAQFRTALNARYDVDPVLANRLSYTRSGEQLLTEAGELVKSPSGLNGFYGLRAALTLAAFDPEGLTLLNFVKHFPTDIRIDVGRALDIVRDLDGILTQTEHALAKMADHTAAIAAAEPTVDFSDLPDPRNPGKWAASVQTLRLYDDQRDRTLVVDLYTPETVISSDSADRLPVIVISNGLGAKRSRFDELAIHLASHGFAVAMPDHPGSDRQRLWEFDQGLHTENFDAAEYIDRPLDVSFLLDELTRLNAEQFENRLDPNQAGVFGYSFGGATALALAGAQIDRAHLSRDCATRSSLFNISLLYQCRALELPAHSPDLKDERIQAVYVFVPFSRSLYGPQGMAQVEGPVFWEATDQDILTPLIIEQLPAFSWLAPGGAASTKSNLDTPASNPDSEDDRYLAVTEGLPHARLTLDVLNRLTDKNLDWAEIKPITETYHQMLSVAFFQVHLADNPVYRPYLQARAAQHLTKPPYRINWK